MFGVLFVPAVLYVLAISPKDIKDCRDKKDAAECCDFRWFYKI